MDLNNVPNSLMKGISKEDFDKLLETLKTVVDECINNINNYNELMEEIKQNNSNEKTDKWIGEFKDHVAFSTEIIKAKYGNIEAMFNRIFEDWEKYKVEQESDLSATVGGEAKSNDLEDKGDTDE